MKAKITVLMSTIAVAFMFLCITPQMAMAQTVETNATINSIAQGPSNVIINATTTTIGTVNFFIPNGDPFKKEFLAIALTGISTGKNVTVLFNAGNLVIYRLAVTN